MSLLLVIPVFDDYLHTGLVPWLPTAVLCTAIMLFGVILLACGIVLDNVATMNELVDGLGLTRSDRGCGALHWTITRLHLHAAVVPSAGAGKQCELGLRADDVRDTAAESRADLEPAVPMFARNGFTLDPATCIPYRAGIGNGVLVYQWCQVSQRDGH